MTSLHQIHRTMARQPWHELERARALLLYDLWQILPEMLQTKPFGELSGHSPGTLPAPPAKACEKRSSGTNSPGSNSPASNIPGKITRDTTSATRPRSNTAAATLSSGKNTNSRTRESFHETEGCTSTDALTQTSHVPGKRPGLTNPVNHKADNRDPKPDSAAVNATRLIYDFAARRVVDYRHRDAGQPQQPIEEKHHAAAPAQQVSMRTPIAIEADAPTHVDAANQDGIENAFAAIRTALSARATRSNTADAQKHLGTPQTVSGEEPARPDPIAAADGTHGRLGEQLMDLINDALVRDARRHGVDV